MRSMGISMPAVSLYVAYKEVSSLQIISWLQSPNPTNYQLLVEVAIIELQWHQCCLQILLVGERQL